MYIPLTNSRVEDLGKSVMLKAGAIALLLKKAIARIIRSMNPSH